MLNVKFMAIAIVMLFIVFRIIYFYYIFLFFEIKSKSITRGVVARLKEERWSA